MPWEMVVYDIILLNIYEFHLEIILCLADELIQYVHLIFEDLHQ